MNLNTHIFYYIEYFHFSNEKIYYLLYSHAMLHQASYYILVWNFVVRSSRLSFLLVIVYPKLAHGLYATIPFLLTNWVIAYSPSCFEC